MRGVTSFLDTMSTTFGFLLTRLMRGVTLTPLSEPAFGKISTHTPHARRDCVKGYTKTVEITFLLTRLMRGVTGSGIYQRLNV